MKAMKNVSMHMQQFVLLSCSFACCHFCLLLHYFLLIHAPVSLISLQSGVTALDRANAAGHMDIVHLLQQQSSTEN